MRKPPLCDLIQVDPSLFTQEAVGHKNPEIISKTARTQAATAVAATAPGGD